MQIELSCVEVEPNTLNLAPLDRQMAYTLLCAVKVMEPQQLEPRRSPLPERATPLLESCYQITGIRYTSAELC